MTDHQPASPLITSDRVDGTPVCGAGETQIGVIENVSGRISYLVLSCGGFLDLGQDHCPIPWAALRYDPELGGYVTGITEDQLRATLERPEDWARDRR